MRLQIELHSETNVRVLRCLGSILFGPEVEHLRVKISELLDQCCCLVLNLAHVQQIDAGGLGLLAWFCNEMGARQQSVRVVCPSRHVSRLLRLSELAQRMELYAAEQAAMESCPQAA